MEERAESEQAPHVWSMEEIKALPEFGGDAGWFYGLVEHQAGREEKVLVIAEIYPGMGWAAADPPSAEDWAEIQLDLTYRAPDPDARPS